jgi:hypothetical protein
MIDDKLKKILVDKIITNVAFSQSSIYPRLLTYLMDCSIRGYRPKESDIAENVFDRDQFDASTDPLIRVHVSKLRKKLEEYYKQQGKAEDVKLFIPPRHYIIEFKKSKQTLPKLISNHTSHAILIGSLFIFLMASAYLFYSNRNLIRQIYIAKKLSGDTFIWSDFLKSKAPTIFVIGNVYIYCEFREDIKTYLIVNNPLINDSKSLEEYIKDLEIPPHYIWEPVWEVIPKSALLNFSRIQWFFRLSEKEITTKLSTKMEWEDFRRNNIIYLGHFHNLGMLREFYNTQHIHSPHLTIDYQKRKALIKTDSLDIILDKIQKNQSVLFLLSSYLESDLQKIEIKYPDIDTTFALYEKQETNYIKDYVAVSKLPGPNKNILLFIISMHQIGRMELMKMLTDFESFENVKAEISQKYKSLPKYFEMIFEVEGYKETAMKIKLLHFFPITQDFQVQSE